MKYGSISDEQKRTLDEMDDEFYAKQGSVLLDNSRTSISPGDQQKRMRARILAVMRDPTILASKSDDQEKGEEEKSTLVLQENFRIMFHVMTTDHQLPDLIWNEQTRLELRSSLETELNGTIFTPILCVFFVLLSVLPYIYLIAQLLLLLLLCFSHQDSSLSSDSEG